MLKGLPTLEALRVYGAADAADAGARALREVVFDNCGGLTDEAARALGGMPKLEAVGFPSCRGITDAGLAAPAELPELRRLSVVGCTGVTDAGPAHVRRMKKLRAPALNETAITDAGLEHLKGMESLEDLNLWLCPKLSKQAKEALERTLPNLKEFTGRGE